MKNMYFKGSVNMSFREYKYKERIIDNKINEYLKIFGAINIEGPKWYDKTWTAKNYVRSVVYLDEQIRETNELLFTFKIVTIKIKSKNVCFKYKSMIYLYYEKYLFYTFT